MNERNAFERQLADEIEYEVGPPRNVDAAAITRQAKSTSPRWRFMTMSTTFKFAVGAGILAAAGTALFLAVPGGAPSDDGAVAPPGAEGSSAAQIMGEGTVLLADHFLCDYGQAWPTRLPACETSADGTEFTLEFSIPQVWSGPFDGLGVNVGTFTGNNEDATFVASGTAFFAGEVEDCGPGTIVFEWSGNGTLDENGRPTWEAGDYVSVPGGLTLPITATISAFPDDREILNGDGTKTRPYSTTYTCELPVAE